MVDPVDFKYANSNISPINFDNGNIDGTLIAGSLKGGGESHHYPFKGDLPRPTTTPREDSKKVPEPSAFAGLGLVGILGIASIRKGKKSEE